MATENASGPERDATPPPGNAAPFAGAPPVHDARPGAERADPALVRAGAEQAWGMACHLATLVTYCFQSAWLNLPGVIAPLILWQLLEARSERASHHAKEAFQFQLNVLAWLVLAWILSGIWCLGSVLHWTVTLVNLVLTLAAALRAAEGERYRYPGILRVLDRGPRGPFGDPGP